MDIRDTLRTLRLIPMDATDYGWDDLHGIFTAPTSGTTAGTRELYDTAVGVYDTAYNTSDVMDWKFHLTHQNILGGDKYLHVHVELQKGAIASGNNLVINAAIAYSRHNRTGSPASITRTFTITPTELNNSANGTVVSESTATIIAKSGGGTGFFDSNVDWVTDDSLKVSLAISQIPTITGGNHTKVFVPFCDIHRQVRYGGTRLRVLTNGSFD